MQIFESIETLPAQSSKRLDLQWSAAVLLVLEAPGGKSVFRKIK
jgi:hypothetical protein